ncbi:MAG: hypothetical protein ACSHWU_01305 [Marinicella sp.]
MTLQITRIFCLLGVLFFSHVSALDDTTGHPTFLSPHSKPIVIDNNNYVFVVNTPNDTVDVINANDSQVIREIPVGIDPVGLAIRPDGNQVWVANHVSDSVSIIDNRPESTTYLQVIATIQDFNPNTKATQFDEPVGIVFADNNKAYVSLSSENKIAVIDTNSYTISRTLDISAQDPRAMFVRNNRLYVIPFESNNQTQISGCVGSLSGGLCTFDATEHVVTNNNVLSQNIVVDIVKHPNIPDRDLFVFDTNTDQLLQTVSGLGTLLYGITVNSEGQVFIAQTDARNDINGAAGTLGDGLAQMGNRAFLNQITQVNCSASTCTNPTFINLEPLPPTHPTTDKALATPFAIQISQDDSTLIMTAASSDQLVLLNATSGEIISQITVGSVPRGIALAYDDSNQLTTSWVFNAVANSVTQVDISEPTQPNISSTIQLEDPTHPEVKLGRIAFNDAKASTTGTFSCESCHPDGGTDQLLWILDTPICSLPGCDQIAPRITMPIRGLRDTAPFHWDGIPGDPYGGSNTANINGFSPANCTLDDPSSCTRVLVDGGLASTMCMTGNCPENDEGKAGALTATERDAMATFLLSVPYPPAQRRAYTNVLSETAEQGFHLFHVDGDLQGNPQPNVCGDCHRMPFWVSTNTPGTGMEAPTWRGAYDRWLILPQGRLNIIDFTFYEILTRLGIPEERMWRLSWAQRPRFNPVWNMVTEGGTGFSGAFARQITLNPQTSLNAESNELFDALETAANEGSILLQGEGVQINETANPVVIQFKRNQYFINGDDAPLSRADLTSMAQQGELVATLTGRLGSRVDVDNPQPAIWTLGTMHLQRGQQRFPTIDAGADTMTISGRHIQQGAHIIIDGIRVPGVVSCSSGTLPNCNREEIQIQLAYLPAQIGLHFLQIQNIDGLVSNDFIFYTTVAGSGMPELDLSGPWFNSTQSGHGWYLELLEPLSAGQPNRLLAYWYTFNNGQPVWLVGQGELINGRSQMAVLSTLGTSFPPDFTAEEISYINWGEFEFEFANDATGSASWSSNQPGFSSGSMQIQKLAAISQASEGCYSGSFINPAQPGHGIGAQIIDTNGQANILLAWYTYVSGKQVWLVGQGEFNEQKSELDLHVFNGANFPPDFNSNEVESIPWGSVNVAFPNPNQMDLIWNSNQENYSSGQMELQRLTQLSGHFCQ